MSFWTSDKLPKISQRKKDSLKIKGKNKKEKKRVKSGEGQICSAYTVMKTAEV